MRGSQSKGGLNTFDRAKLILTELLKGYTKPSLEPGKEKTLTNLVENHTEKVVMNNQSKIR